MLGFHLIQEQFTEISQKPFRKILARPVLGPPANRAFHPRHWMRFCRADRPVLHRKKLHYDWRGFIAGSHRHVQNPFPGSKLDRHGHAKIVSKPAF